MRLLTVNTGSTSVRLGLYEVTPEGAGEILFQRHPLSDEPPERRLRAFLGLEMPEAVVHRVVHGGDSLTAACLIDGTVERKIQQLNEIAPLHNPIALAWIRACRLRFGTEMPQIAVFDTAFFAGLPPHAAHYALPRPLTERLKIRRYGFHGIAHRALWRRWKALRPDLPEGGRLITVQLGGGCSMAAIDRGRPQEISMGFSPAEGLMMATRSGDLDPSVITYLLRREHLSAMEIDRLVNREAGLLGVSRQSGDITRLLGSEEPEARLAVTMYLHRLRKYLGAYLAVLRGADGILLGGGVSEHAPEIRGRALAGMEWAGLRLDDEANRALGAGEGRISAAGSAIEARVVRVNEEGELIDEARALLGEVDSP